MKAPVFIPLNATLRLQCRGGQSHEDDDRDAFITHSSLCSAPAMTVCCPINRPGACRKPRRNRLRLSRMKSPSIGGPLFWSSSALALRGICAHATLRQWHFPSRRSGTVARQSFTTYRIAPRPANSALREYANLPACDRLDRRLQGHGRLRARAFRSATGALLHPILNVDIVVSIDARGRHVAPPRILIGRS